MQKHIKLAASVAICLTLLWYPPSPVNAETRPSRTTDLGTRGFGVDWPVFLGPTGDSKSSEQGIRRDWSGDKLPVAWTMPLQMSYGTCTVALGRLLQFDARPVSRDQNIGIVYCQYSETGKAIWKYEYEYEYGDQYGYNNGPRTSPIVDEHRVYVLGVDGMLICLDLASGTEIWKVATATKFGVIQNFFGVGSNPVVVGDNILVMVGGSPQPTRLDRAQGNGSGIVAFNKYTGDVAYQISDQLASYASLKVVEQSDRAWCFAFMRGGLLAFDPQNGVEDFFFPWRAKIVESVNASVPVVFGRHVFISETYGPGSVLLDFGNIRNNAPAVIWQDAARSREKSLQTHWNTPIHHHGYIYGSSGRHTQNAELRCIQAMTGKVMWSEPGLSRASLLLVDEHFVCLDEMGGLRLVRADSSRYQEVTRASLQERNGKPLLKYPAWAAPVLSHGLLYVRGKDRLACLELIPDKQ